jgi:hypothetical protein
MWSAMALYCRNSAADRGGSDGALSSSDLLASALAVSEEEDDAVGFDFSCSGQGGADVMFAVAAASEEVDMASIF